MTTPSPKLGLALPAKTDPFSTADLKANWDKIDASPGSYICTSSTRPTWTSAQAGRKIMEVNTGLEWMWDGSKFVRLAASGLLKRSDGTWAIGERTTNFPTTSTSYVQVVTVPSVVVPAGNRPIRVEVQWRAITAATGAMAAIFRSKTNGSGPIQTNWNLGSTSTGEVVAGGSFFSVERDGLPAGTYDFSFQVHAVTGTLTINGDTTTPIGIFVSEM